MDAQPLRLARAVVAQRAAVFEHALVHVADVLRDVVLARERLIADVALVRLLQGVRERVSVHRVLPVERERAIVTLAALARDARPVRRVDDRVTTQLVRAREPLAAVRAHVLLMRLPSDGGGGVVLREPIASVVASALCDDVREQHVVRLPLVAAQLAGAEEFQRAALAPEHVVGPALLVGAELVVAKEAHLAALALRAGCLFSRVFLRVLEEVLFSLELTAAVIAEKVRASRRRGTLGDWIHRVAVR